MCTVTVVPWRGLVSLAVNRDELHTRPTALPPEVRAFGPHRAILPVDAAAGGTWVAVNDAPLAMAVLNVSKEPGTSAPAPALSRGTVIPSLLSSATLSEAIRRTLALDARIYAPFRLLIVDHQELAEIRSNGGRLDLVNREPLTRPYLLTSSGLGDRLVLEPRSALFAETFSPDGSWLAAQKVYHRHVWPDRPHLSVCMRRPEARTVSQTLITLGPRKTSLTYHPDAPDQPAGRVSVELVLRKGVER